MTTNKNEQEKEVFYNTTFSFEVDCNAEGVQEIRKELYKFLQSKNWFSKNVQVKTNFSKDICWITDCNKQAIYYRKLDSNPRPSCKNHYNKLPSITKRHYFKI